MAAGPSRGDAVLSEINVTPLVDVMLVLLIIFMVTAPLAQQGVDVDLPEARAQAIAADDQKLVLTIDRERRVFLGKTEIKWEELEDKLRHNAKIQSEKELYLHADKNLTYGIVVQVMAVAKSAGVDRLGMVTDPLAAPPSPPGPAPSRNPK